MKAINILLLLLTTVLFCIPAVAEPKKKDDYLKRFSPKLKQTQDSEDRLNKWFRDSKYGVFIHFGVYSELAGKHKDEVANHGYSEWIRRSLSITPKEYHEVSAKFNPSEFNAQEWAKIFKNAGLKYVVITSKHHDGFALFDSEVSDYNIVDYTPFKRDIIKELCDACHEEGLKFGVYYSHAKDWDEIHAPELKIGHLRKMNPDLPADFKPDNLQYFEKKSFPQMEELLTNYELDLVWFDTPHKMTPELAKRFSEMVRKHRPDCLINSRILFKGSGVLKQEALEYFDYGSLRDKEVPPYPPTKGAIYVESPDSVSHSYGYKAHGKITYHTEKEMIDRFVSTVCNGGNYLLNNGPMGNGKLDPEAVRLYGVIGDWLKVNGQSIYNTRPNPLKKRPEWGDISISKDAKTLYLHILQWPESGSITVKGVSSSATAASFLANGETAEYSQSGDSLIITLPTEPLDQYDTVIKVSL